MIIQAARKLGMLVVPEGGSLFEQNMSMIADGHSTIEHSIPVAKIYDDVLQFWKGSGTAYTPTMVVTFGGAFGENYWYQHTDVWKEPILSRWVPRPLLDARSRRPVKNPPEEDNLIANAAVAKKISDLGVPVSIGAHGQREGLGAHWDIWSFVLGGMSNIEALRAATINPARALGLVQGSRHLDRQLADLVCSTPTPETSATGQHKQTGRRTIAIQTSPPSPAAPALNPLVPANRGRHLHAGATSGPHED